MIALTCRLAFADVPNHSGTGLDDRSSSAPSDLRVPEGCPTAPVFGGTPTPICHVPSKRLLRVPIPGPTPGEGLGRRMYGPVLSMVRWPPGLLKQHPQEPPVPPRRGFFASS